MDGFMDRNVQFKSVPGHWKQRLLKRSKRQDCERKGNFTRWFACIRGYRYGKGNTLLGING